jgi:[lysine-biosynthesis-protein LysW]--L-2-aminoadipate ligase
MSPLLIAGRLTPPNVRLLRACRRLGAPARLLPPDEAARRAHPDEIVLGRVDVAPTLDGVEPGLDALRRLEAAGQLVLNRAGAIVAAHDKLATARALAQAGLPHPWTAHVRPGDPLPLVDEPVVVKPRFGSWGADVLLCASQEELEQTFEQIAERHWFQVHGALVQELLPPPGYDLRVLVAGGAAVGAISRHAAVGEWRTNVALGGTRHRAVPSEQAVELAVAAAAAIDADLVGVDLLPVDGGYAVIELNGCVDFTAAYSQPGRNVFEDVVTSLLFPQVAVLAELAELQAAREELPVVT